MYNQCNGPNEEPVRALSSRREVLTSVAAVAAAPFLGRVTSIVQAAQATKTGVPVGCPAHSQGGKVGASNGSSWMAARMVLKIVI
jgi:hypothetical protein